MIVEALCLYAAYKGMRKVSGWSKKVVEKKEVEKKIVEKNVASKKDILNAKKARQSKLRHAKNIREAKSFALGLALLPLLPLALLLGDGKTRKPKKRVAYEDTEWKGGSNFHL